MKITVTPDEVLEMARLIKDFKAWDIAINTSNTGFHVRTSGEYNGIKIGDSRAAPKGENLRIDITEIVMNHARAKREELRQQLLEMGVRV